MDLSKLKKDIVILRNYHLGGVEMCDRILKEIEILSPSNPRKRRNLKAERIQHYDNYITTGIWRKQKEVTNKTIKL